MAILDRQASQAKVGTYHAPQHRRLKRATPQVPMNRRKLSDSLSRAVYPGGDFTPLSVIPLPFAVHQPPPGLLYAWLKYPVTNVIHRITPSAKAAQKEAGKWRATAGELLQVTEPVPSPCSSLLQSRISAVHLFGKVLNRPTSAGSFFFC
jgi:hypothetical protein